MQLFLGHITGEFQLDAAEVQHYVKVLRKVVGDKIHFITGDEIYIKERSHLFLSQGFMALL